VDKQLNIHFMLIKSPGCSTCLVQAAKGVTKHRTIRTALKYGEASCGEEYTPGNDHVGFNY